MLRSYADENQEDWDVLLPKTLLGNRSSVQTTTGFSPFSLIYGREAMLPIDIVFGGSKERFESKNKFVSQQRDHMDRAFEKVRDLTKMKQRRQKCYYNWKVHPSNQKPKYCISDWVRVYNPSTTKARVKKLRRCYRGPYRVIKVISETVYRVQKIGGRQRLVVHYNRLKDASQENVAAQEAATDETSTPTPATGTVINTGAEAESNTDLGNTNTENPTYSTVRVNIPNGMIVSRKSEVTPIETRPRLVVSSPVVGQNVHNENSVVDDMVGVQEYM